MAMGSWRAPVPAPRTAPAPVALPWPPRAGGGSAGGQLPGRGQSLPLARPGCPLHPRQAQAGPSLVQELVSHLQDAEDIPASTLGITICWEQPPRILARLWASVPCLRASPRAWENKAAQVENYSKLFLAAVLRALNNISDSLGEQQKGAAPPAQQSVEQVVRHTGRQRHRTKPGEMGIACIPSFPA